MCQFSIQIYKFHIETTVTDLLQWFSVLIQSFTLLNVEKGVATVEGIYSAGIWPFSS